MRTKLSNNLAKAMRPFNLRDAATTPALFERILLMILAHAAGSMRHLTVVLAYVAFTAGGVQAQTANFDPPDLKLVDSVGVNLISGKAQFHSSPVSIGPKDSGLTFNLDFNGGADWVAAADGFAGEVYQASNWPYYDVAVSMFNKSDMFRGGATTDTRETGSTLTLKTDGTYEYVSREGVRYITNSAIKGWHNENCCLTVAITKVVYPNGYEININRSPLAGTPILSVTTNYGYQLRYSYNAAKELVNVTAVNLAVDYCDPAAASCTYSRTWPSATFLRESAVVNFVGPTTLTTTDSANKVTKYFTEDGYSQYLQTGYHYSRLTSVKWPSSPSATNVTLRYGNMFACRDGGGYWACDDLRGSIVTSADIGTGHWTYSYTEDLSRAPNYPGVDHPWTATATSQEGFVTTAHYDVNKGLTNSVRTSNGTRDYDRNLSNRLLKASDAEGRVFDFTYDARGNILTKTQTGTGGIGSLILEANYDVACNNPVTCNKPNWVKDANGNRTDYTYDPAHGGLLTETSAPDANGVRPQKRNKYVQRTALVKNNAGGYSAAGPSIWVLDSSSYCRTSNATTIGCQAPNDEVVTSHDYGATSGANNLMLRGQVVTADGVSRRACYAYDVLGNMVSETTVNAGLTKCN
jgi:YD repeat-containing protein